MTQNKEVVFWFPTFKGILPHTIKTYDLPLLHYIDDLLEIKHYNFNGKYILSYRNKKTRGGNYHLICHKTKRIVKKEHIKQYEENNKVQLIDRSDIQEIETIEEFNKGEFIKKDISLLFINKTDYRIFKDESGKLFYDKEFTIECQCCGKAEYIKYLKGINEINYFTVVMEHNLSVLG